VRQIRDADTGAGAAAETAGGIAPVLLFLRRVMLMMGPARHHIVMLMRARLGGECWRHRKRERQAGGKSQHC